MDSTVGKKSSKNSLVRWTKQNWEYASEKMKGIGRYLPHKVWEQLSPGEKAATNRKKIQAPKKAKYSKKVNELVKNS